MGQRDVARDQAFTEYYAARAANMRASAYLLCGDWHLAQDLVQVAFTKLYLAWRRVSRHDALDRYTRRVLFRTFLDSRRRRREHPADLRTGAEPAVDAQAPEERLVLLAALAAVPPRQRATLVLRYWEDLSVEATAEILKCSPGTVKSQTARGLQTLRDLLAGDAMPEKRP